MAQTKRPEANHLQVHEDLRFQRRDWLVQRVGWVALAALLLAGLLGLLGSGPLSHVASSNGRGLAIEHERFVRHGAQTSLVVRVQPGVLTSDRARIAISRRFLAAHDLQRIVPEPERTRVRGDDVEFVFDAQPRDGMQIRWTFDPDRLGGHATVIRLNEEPPVTIQQFTYP